MKYLIDTQTDEIRGRYEEPLDFSISGRYVIDTPTGFGINPQTNSLSTLIQDKINTFIRLHPTLPNFFFDELLTVPPPNIDPAPPGGPPPNTQRYLTGPNKRTAILPGGSITTNTLVTIAGFNTVYLHLHGFVLHSEPGNPSASHPSPSRLLYNHDGTNFITFDYNDLLIEYWDSAMAGVIFTPTPEAEEVWIQGAPLNFRIKFTNIHASRIYYLSDWAFLYSNP